MSGSEEESVASSNNEEEEVEQSEEEVVEPVKKKRTRKKKKKGKDPNKPKRNMSAYFLYSNAMRKTFKEENPEASFGELVSNWLFFHFEGWSGAILSWRMIKMPVVGYFEVEFCCLSIS